METYLAITSRREIREYEARSIPPELVDRILDAGRVTGSSKNTQPWTFIVTHNRDRLTALARCVTRPSNLEHAPLAIAIVVEQEKNAFDAGRVAQNMMLAAWDLGLGSCPNTVRDLDVFRAIVGSEEGLPRTILTFGYPVKRIRPERRSAEDWVAAADRKDRSEVVRILD